MKNTFSLLTIILFLTSCNKDFLQKEEGHFTINGTKVTFDADHMKGELINDSTVTVVLGGSADSPHNVNLTLDLKTMGGVMPIFSLNKAGFGYSVPGVGYYKAISGLYEVTEHVVGNPATQHTEGTFRFLAVNEYDTADTMVISEGYFHVSNY